MGTLEVVPVSCTGAEKGAGGGGGDVRRPASRVHSVARTHAHSSVFDACEENGSVYPPLTRPLCWRLVLVLRRVDAEVIRKQYWCFLVFTEG